MGLQKRVLAASSLFCFLCGPPAAFSCEPPPASAQTGESSDWKVDYSSTRRDIQKFEAVVAEVINSSFSSSPFALVQRPKGAYLQGYGFTFAFLINIHRAVINTPFGEIRAQGNDVTPELKKRRIEEFKEKLIGVLRDYGETLHQLRPEDHVTLIAFFEDRNFPDEPNENKTLVLTLQKRDLDASVRKDSKEFKQRIRIVEY